MKQPHNAFTVLLGAAAMFAVQARGGVATNDWFNAGVSGYTVGAIPETVDSAGTWTRGTDDNSSVIADGGVSRIQLDTAGDLLRFTPAAASGSAASPYVDFSVLFTAADADPDMTEVANPQASISVRQDGDDLYYIAYSNGAWVRLYGATPVEDALVDVRVEMDYTSANAPRVSYLVKVNGEYVRLADAATDGDVWLPLASAVTTRSIASVAFLGSGLLGDLTGKQIVEIAAFVVTLDGQDTPIALDPAWIAVNVGADATPAEVNAFLATTGDNGLPEWKSYVLGMDDGNPLWIGAVQTADTATMRIRMNGPAATLPDSGITVAYRLQRKVNGEWTTVSAQDQASPQFDVSLSDGNPTGLYRILAVFTAAE